MSTVYLIVNGIIVITAMIEYYRMNKQYEGNGLHIMAFMYITLLITIGANTAIWVINTVGK